MKQKVFISYSRGNSDHEDWTLTLAKRLVSDGIDVALDKWDLREGHDLYQFMESMVTSPEINKVLIILDQKYANKANDRSGGVGAETQIISPEIYENAAQEKFIPVVAEKDETGKPFIPAYLKTRLYIDLSEEDNFEEGYETLIRNIFNRPSLSKPKIGNPPGYLFENSINNFRTSLILRTFDNTLTRHPERINGMVRNFLDSFVEELGQFKIEETTASTYEAGKLVVDFLHRYTPLRNDFILFFDKLVKSEAEFDFDILVSFLETLPVLCYPAEDRSWQPFQYDGFKFIIHEIFIYLVTAGVKNNNFEFLENLFYTSYYTKDKNNLMNEAQNFKVFNKYIDIVDTYLNESQGRTIINPNAYLLISRIPDFVSRQVFVDADLLCHYIADLNGFSWFPKLYIYSDDTRVSNNLEIFYKLSSLKHFNKVKNVLGVNTIEQLRDKLDKIEQQGTSKGQTRYSMARDSVPPLYTLINREQIGSKR